MLQISKAAAIALAFGIATLTPATASASAVKPYTQKVCVVSGNELGSMGKVITKTYKDQEVKFCCKPCIKKFDANPEKFLPKEGKK